MGGTVTNDGTSTITLTLQAKLYEGDECEPTFSSDPGYTVTLNPGESWSPPERWEETITKNYDFHAYTMLPEREGC